MKLSDIKLKAVILGVLVDYSATLCFSYVLGLTIGIISVVGRNPSAARISSLAHSMTVEIFALLGGTLSTVLGGFIAALIAPQAARVNSLAAGVGSLILGVSVTAFSHGSSSPWKLAIGLILTIPAAWLGGCMVKPKVILSPQ